MNPLILASASPRRKEILALLKIPFSVVPADIEEKVLSVGDIVPAAKEKALFVYQKYPAHIILGADTVVALGDKILGKPKDLEDAKQMIALLSGKTHSVYTGVSIISASHQISGLVETKVSVKPLEESEIHNYPHEEYVLDAAGAYKIQGCFSKFIEKIDGDYLNIVGLPLQWVYEHLKAI